MYYMEGTGASAGQGTDALSTSIANLFTGVLSKTVIGAPGSKERESNADFYASVLAKTGEKFAESPVGQKTINKIFVVGLGGGALLGLFAGYLLFKK